MATLKEIKVGDTVRLKNDRYLQYGVGKGEAYKVSYKQGSSIQIQAPDYGPLNIQAADLDVGPQTKEEIREEVKKLEEALKVRKNRLKWMEDTGSETYDEDEFKVWQILNTMDSKSSKIEKARAIAAIVKK